MSWDTALNWAFLCFTDFKRRKYSLSSPIPIPMQCCADVRATYRKQLTLLLWTEGTGEGCGLFCSLKLPYLSTMSQQFFLPIVWIAKVAIHPLEINSTHFFMLGCKTLGGFLFAMFDFIIPILEYGNFVIFCAWQFVSRLTCLDIV